MGTYMMTDLVASLRASASVTENLLELEPGHPVPKIMHQAADSLEKAQARILELEESCKLSNAVTLGERLAKERARAEKYKRGLTEIATSFEYSQDTAIKRSYRMLQDIARESLRDDKGGEG